MTSSATPPHQRPSLAIQVGSTKLTGPAAIATLVLLLGLLAGLVVWLRPAPRMLVSATLWLLFLLYWGAAARNVAPTKSAESPASRAVHTRLLNLSLLLLFLPVPGLRTRFVPLTNPVVAAGLALQAASIMFAIWARRHLGRNWSGAVAVAVDHQVVRSGPYRVVRHPIYSAMLGMYLGTGLVSGELHALLALGVVTAAYARKIPLEERTLGEVFGTEYEAYRRQTWALIPGLF